MLARTTLQGFTASACRYDARYVNVTSQGHIGVYSDLEVAYVHWGVSAEPFKGL